MSPRCASGGDVDAVMEQGFCLGLEPGEIEVCAALLEGDHNLGRVRAELDGGDAMPGCKLGQEASRFPQQAIVRAGQLHTEKGTPSPTSVARLGADHRLGGSRLGSRSLGRSGESNRRFQVGPEVPLHHGCTTSVGQEGSSGVSFGQAEMGLDLRFRAS